MQIAFILDIIIAVLLVLTITYAVRLNQRLGQLRKDKNELQELAKTFAEATAKAETSIQNLKISTEALQADLKEAETIRDDLSYLVERGGRTADQMAATVRTPGSAPGSAFDDEDDAEDDNRLIEEAIRAASTAGAGRSAGLGSAKGAGKRSDGERPGNGRKGNERTGGGLFGRLRGAGATARDETPAARPDVSPDASPVTRRVSGLGAPESAPDMGASRTLGGGLGGVSPQDRLIDERPRTGASGTIGDTDAARELLKALSSVK